MTVKLYGIPTCESCRHARTWLDEHDVRYEWVDLRETPPRRETIAAWVEHLGSKPLRNTSGGAYRALGDEKRNWDDARWVTAFTADPMLLKRPLLELDGRAVSTGFKAAAFAERFLDSRG